MVYIVYFFSGYVVEQWVEFVYFVLDLLVVFIVYWIIYFVGQQVNDFLVVFYIFCWRDCLFKLLEFMVGVGEYVVVFVLGGGWQQDIGNFCCFGYEDVLYYYKVQCFDVFVYQVEVGFSLQWIFIYDVVGFDFVSQCFMWYFGDVGVDLVIYQCWVDISGGGEFFLYGGVGDFLIIWEQVWQYVYIVGVLYVVLFVDWFYVDVCLFQVVGEQCQVCQIVYYVYCLVKLGDVYVLYNSGGRGGGEYVYCFLDFLCVDFDNFFYCFWGVIFYCFVVSIQFFGIVFDIGFVVQFFFQQYIVEGIYQCYVVVVVELQMMVGNVCGFNVLWIVDDDFGVVFLGFDYLVGDDWMGVGVVVVKDQQVF